MLQAGIAIGILVVVGAVFLTLMSLAKAASNRGDRDE